MFKISAQNLMYKWMVILLVFALSLGARGAQVVNAAGVTITVNDLSDNTTAGDGKCTLREAITNANGNNDTTSGDCATGVDEDMIQFSIGGTITLGSTLPTILFGAGKLKIDGGNSVTVSGNNAVRVFFVNPFGSLTLQNLTIADGRIASQGAGLGNAQQSIVSVINSTFTNNHSTGGGGAIENVGGTVTIEDSIISNNSTTNGLGGGLSVVGGGTINIMNSTVFGNSASGAPNAGGGLASRRDLSYTMNIVNISNTVFSGNTAGAGGGLYNESGTISIDKSTFDGNAGRGGGLTHLDISYENRGILRPASVLTITNSAIVNNTATLNNTDGPGGGIWVSLGVTANITNSTFSGNSAPNNTGGGIYSAGNTTITNSTFIGNSANSGSGGQGGGIAGIVTIKNTIIADNPSGRDCAAHATIVAVGVNLDSDGSCTGFTMHADPLVGPLDVNGGVTRTHALLDGSPAIDAGDMTICQNAPVNNLDQRGVSRLADGDADGAVICDLGAYEAPFGTSSGTRSPTQTPLPTSSPTDTPTSTPNFTPTVTSTLTPTFTPTFTFTPTETVTPSQTSTHTPTATNLPTDTPTATATASQTSTATMTFTPTPTTFHYNFSGFFQPVDNLPTLNVVNAGKGLSVKFSLSGDQGLNILAAGYPISQPIVCDGSLPLDTIEQVVTASNSSLSYDPATSTYIYKWKTEKAWAGTCRQLIVKLSDGTDHKANFKFK